MRRSQGATGTIGHGQPRDPETEALERDLSARLGMRVEIAFNGKHGSVRIHYRSLDQLDGLIALLNRD
jgi:ParB family chromosome partitioning protein